MNRYRPLDGRVLVAGQIATEELPAIAALGVKTIVNNRPDGEESGQPTSAQIEAAARAAGLDYLHIPVAGGFSQDQIGELAASLSKAEGKALLFCRSGMRSTCLWALTRKAGGGDGQEIVRRAAEAGYDLSPLQGFLLR